MKSFLVVTLWVFSIVSLFGQNERDNVRKGNKFFDEEKYVEAEVAYRRALEKKDNMLEGLFNLGGAMYKQEKFPDAVEQYQALAGTVKDKNKLAGIYHNIGNSLLQSGKIKESIDAYKEALRNNPQDDQTRYNLAYAQKKLQDQQKQNKQNKDQDKQEQKQDQKKQQKKDQNQDDQKDKKDQKQQDQKQQQQQSPQSNQISQEDARRLLEALQQDEKETQERVKKAKAKSNQRRKVEKDW